MCKLIATRLFRAYKYIWNSQFAHSDVVDDSQLQDNYILVEGSNNDEIERKKPKHKMGEE